MEQENIILKSKASMKKTRVDLLLLQKTCEEKEKQVI